MTSTEPLSSTALSSTIWDIDSGADTLFGDSPYDFSYTPPPSASLFGKSIAGILDYMRQSIWPSIMDSANTTQIQVIYKSQSVDPSDVLNVTTVETTFDVYGVVTGASAKNIERGFVIATDFEVRIAAYDLTTVPTARRDAVKVGGVNYDIIGVLPCPNVPSPIGYVFFLRRAI